MVTMFEVGLIGTGNMGGALARAIARSGEKLLLCNRSLEKAAALAEELGSITGSNAEAAKSCRFLLLGVKPQGMAALLTELRPVLQARKDRFVLVSMAAGLPISAIKVLAGVNCPVVRIMPNLPVALGEGVVLLSADGETAEEELAVLERLMAGAGLILRLPEEKLDAGSAVSGCGPAYVYTFLEALAEGGVRCGLTYDQSLELAAQTLIGAGKMAMVSGEHPARLRAQVCSPGGTTIAGVQALEEHAFRAGAMAAVTAAYERTLELRKG